MVYSITHYFKGIFPIGWLDGWSSSKGFPNMLQKLLFFAEPPKAIIQSISKVKKIFSLED
jgi:hypothetical protein